MLLYSKLSCFILLCVLFSEICDGRAGIKLFGMEDKITPNIRYGLSEESKHVGTGMLSEELIFDETVTLHAALYESTTTTGNSSDKTEVVKPVDRPAIVGYGYKVESDISSAAIASLAGG